MVEAIELDPDALAAARTRLREFSPALRRTLAPRLLAAGEVVAGDVRAAIRAYPSRRTGGTVRQEMADSIQVRQYGRPPAVGVMLLSTGQKLPVSKRALVKAWNLSEYRHPVFAKPGQRSGRRWVSQLGARYFTSGYVLRRQGLITRAFQDAIDDAVASTERNR